MVTLARDAVYPEQGIRHFYVTMAAVCVAVAFVGFAPTYWVPLWSGSLEVPRVVHVHGIFFFAWTLFLLLQTTLVATNRTLRHREMGMVGIALATATVFSGVLVAIRSLDHGIAQGFGDQARAFSIVPLSSVTFFAVMVGFAIANVKRPAFHKRAMLLATISILQAAIARWFRVFLAPPDAVGPSSVLFTVPSGLVVELLVAAAVLHDWRRRGRPHPVYVIGGLCLIAMHWLRVPLSTTSTWFAIADWFAAFAE